MPGTPLSLPEREEISVALIEDHEMPWAKIARRVGRHPTTIAREVNANGGRRSYRPAVASQRALTLRRRPRCRRLESAGGLRTRITAELKLGRSPVAIWADLVADDVVDRPCGQVALGGSESRTAARSARPSWARSSLPANT